MSKKVSQQRKRSAVVAALAAVALLVTGTLAWQSISQKAINNFDGESGEAGARLHDDFADDQVWTQGANKDVYVENYTGQNEDNPLDTGRTVFVRVRLSEYMEMGEGSGLFSFTGTSDPVDYQDLDRAGTGGTRIADSNNKATPLIPGTSITEVADWPIHIPDTVANEDGSEFHDYWDWKMGGQKVFMPTFNRDNTSFLADRTDYDQNQYTAGVTEKKPTTYSDPVLDKEETHTAKDTENTAGVLTMAEWKAKGSPMTDASGNGYWVGDTDGWFYWSKALAPGEATGLLLDEVTLTNEPDGSYYYAIHVVSQMATAGDWGDPEVPSGFYEDGMTEDGKNLLDQAADRMPAVTGITIREGDVVFVREGATIDLHADVTVKYPTGDPKETNVTWSTNPDSPNFVGGSLATEVGDAGDVYVVTASSEAYPDVKTTSTTVIVYPAAGEGTVGPMDDGKYYVDYGDNTYREIKKDGTLGDWKCAGKDTEIGNADDIFTVHVNNDGVKLLGPNPDGSYYIKGEVADGKDGLLGTLDDPKVWPDPDLNNLSPSDPENAVTYDLSITQVKDTGKGANTVMQKGTIQYDVVVTKTSIADGTKNADNQNVKWEFVGGPYATGTAFDNTAYTEDTITLTAGETETIADNQIRIKVTSEEGGATKTFAVSVVAYEENLGETPVGGGFEDASGVEWIVLGEENGYKLLITKYVQGGRTYQYNNVGTAWIPFESSWLKSRLQVFYETEVGADIKKIVVAYEPLTDVRNGSSNYTADTELGDAANGWSHPGTAAATTNGSNAVFTLSLAEVNRYWPPATNKADRVTMDVNGVPRSWWTRSPGNPACCIVSNSNGSIQNINGNLQSYFRPTLWIKSAS